ncbi:hypothetical protein B0H67DRAFT_679616 [Lasiosphaeris hirsuta]|uniref:Uncharacterized protein n=1 Tax=Lasiosphaeris hirsuta TaxID=260670 RepID=A0AA40EBH9_9PEZI|nr:hypothetical protein B0H67DRAFT_679616 [Lasiosphaeris hirsuta]
MILVSREVPECLEENLMENFPGSRSRLRPWDGPRLSHRMRQSRLRRRLNSKDSHGSTPLHCAAVMGNMEMFVFLLQRGVSQECVVGR